MDLPAPSPSLGKAELLCKDQVHMGTQMVDVTLTHENTDCVLVL